MTKKYGVFQFCFVLCAMLLAAFVCACSSSAGGEEEPPLQPPLPPASVLSLTTISPVASGSDIAKTTTFLLTFNMDVDSSTLPGNVILTKAGVAVAMNTSVNANVITAVPVSPLTNSATYVLTITTDLCSSSGKSFDRETSFTYKVVAEGAPTISVSNGNFFNNRLAPGAYTNKDLIVSLTSPYSLSGGSLSLLWSNDGISWTEVPSGNTSFFETTLATVDGTTVYLKGRYTHNSVPYESSVEEYHIDKSAPTIVSTDGSVPGTYRITFSEPVFSINGSNQLGFSKPLAVADFSLQSYGYSRTTLLGVEVDEAGSTVSLTYRYIEGDGVYPINATINCCDRSGNDAPTSHNTGILLVKPPMSISVVSNSSGSLTVSAPVAYENAPSADSFLAAISLSDSSGPADTEYRSASWNGSITFDGLDPDKRYYVFAKSAIGTVGSSYGKKIGVHHWGHIYPVPLFTQGDGTAANPWLIHNRAELECMLEQAAMRDDHFRLVADIDLSAYRWQPVESSSFSGTLDGAGYAISNAVISTNGYGGEGLFMYIKDATVKDLLLKDFSFPQGTSPCCVLADNVSGNSTLTGIAVTGLSGQRFSGLISDARCEEGETIVISRCFVQGSVDGASGGLASELSTDSGLNGTAGKIIVQDCFVAVDSTVETGNYTSGFVGAINYNVSLSRCFTSGRIHTTDEQEAGGLLGHYIGDTTAKPSISYSISMAPSIGDAAYAQSYRWRFRLLYDNFASMSGITVTGGYANSDMLVDGVTVADGDPRDGTGMTIAAFKDAASPCFAVWDFTDVWVMGTTGPMLRSMPLGGGAFGTPSIDPVAWD